jgi:hypothetical protein
MTVTRHPWIARALAIPRRAIHALRYADDELLRASEAMIRSARAPRPRPQVQASAAGQPCQTAGAERVGKAA